MFLAIILSLVMGASNACIRGAFLGKISGSRYIHAAIVGLSAFLVCFKWYAFPIMFVATAIGQLPGWGSYIEAIGGGKVQKEQAWIDFLIRPLESKPKLWGAVGLSLRGGFWGLFYAIGVTTIAYLATGHLSVSFLPLIGGLTMGLCYTATYYAQTKLKIITEYWACGEFLFGTLSAIFFLLDIYIKIC